MSRKRWRMNRFIAVTLAVILVIGLVQVSPVVKAASENTVAYWKFGQSGIKEGTIADGNLVINDQSGNNNDLKMQLYKDKKLTTNANAADWTKYLSYEDNAMLGTAGSMVFNGNNTEGIGADFITVENAAINTNKFEDGYTIEFLYYLPKDWTAADQWMGLLARQVKNSNNVKGMDEPQLGSMSISISNCKEIQFLTAPANDLEKMSSAAWSVSMDKGGVWYHIAITSDGEKIRTFVNGNEAFRDYESSGMKGLFADSEDGRFRVGSSWWLEGSQTLDKFLQGNLQEIRISNTAIDKSDWLVTNPAQFAGEYGSNESYTLENEDNYNFVFLPDTQNTIKFKPDVMNTAIDELINTADALNVAGVVSLGDIVENNNDGNQYDNARNAFYKMPEQGIKFLAQKGNHDGWSAGISNYYNSFSKYSSLFMQRTASYLTNDSPSGDSSYMIVPAGSYNYLVIALSCSGSESGKHNNTAWASEDEEWLRNVLKAYPNCPTIVTSHDVQNCSDTEPNAITLSWQGQKLWNIVKSYDQVFLMIGGHSHGSGVETLINNNGKPVISVLADYQFAYNGGNGLFKYAEFDENQNKIFLKTYSPYAASLEAEEKTFYDVNFLTGDGNYNEIGLNFSQRFAGMEVINEESTAGKWMSGEFHAHTNQSNDAQVSSSKFENILDVAFREDGYTNIPGAENILEGTGFDFFFTADHLRKSISDENGNSTADKPRYIGIEQQIKKFTQLTAQGKYENKIFFPGFEWDMPGLDHASVGIIDKDSNSAITKAIHEFEWLFADQNNDSDALYENNGSREKQEFGERKATSSGGRSQVSVAYEGVEWLKNNYPESYLLINHPSRHNGGSGVVTVRNMRTLNDIAPNIVFGFEGMPGNELSPDGNRSEMNDIYGGADVVLSEIGGIWDSMLAEGRHFYNFANSDFHFKVSNNNSSGYYPSEYARNYTFVEAGEDSTFDAKDVVSGMRSGNSFAVFGDLIDGLMFNAKDSKNTAAMGSDLQTTSDETVTLTIRFKSPEKNNYAEITGHGSTVSNAVSVDHIDLISGEITGKLDESDYDKAVNDTTTVIKRFTRDDWGEADTEGYYTINFDVPADTDRYYRLRGTNLEAGTVGYTGEDGNPLQDTAYMKTGVPDFNTRVNLINDRNYTGLWFYSNPIFVYTAVSSQAELNELRLSEGTLTPEFDSKVFNYVTVVSPETENIVVEPIAVSGTASIKINGTQVVTSAAIGLEEGNNTITIEVTAQDGITSKTYTVVVIKDKEEEIKYLTIGSQSDEVIAGIAKTIFYPVTTSGIKEDALVSVNWCDKLGGSIENPEGITVKASPVIASGSSITFDINEKAVAGKYYFTVESEGIHSAAAMLTINEPSVIPSYTVTFVDWDNRLIAAQTVLEGTSAEAPGNPVRSGYTFIGWDKDFSSVKADMTVIAIYKKLNTETQPEPQLPSGPYVPSVPQIVIEIVAAAVKGSENNHTLTQVLIERTKKEDGTKKDSVTFQLQDAQAAIEKMKGNKIKTAVIVIPDDKNEVFETEIKITADAIKALAKDNINLEINTQEGSVYIASDALKKLVTEWKDELTFKIVPVTDKKQQSKLLENVLSLVQKVKASSKKGTQIVGESVTVDTNVPSLEASLTIPLTGITIPVQEKARDELFKKLAVYIKHTDGEEELVSGTIAKNNAGAYEMTFPVEKFSSFSIVKTEALLKSSENKVTKVTAPSKAHIGKQTIKATVGSTVNRVTLKLSVSNKAVWDLYSDKAGTKKIANNIMKLKTGANYAYAIVTAEDGSKNVYKVTITRSYGKADITKVTVPKAAVIKGNTITATVSDIKAVTIKLTTNDKAVWKLYSDKSLKKEIAGNKMKLTTGTNKAYIKVTSKDGKVDKVYTIKIIRKASEKKI
jgi:hypothetical protein